MDIDLVYLWVNGNDPKWIAKRDACIGKPSDKQENCAGRYADSGELKYSLRSIEKYAPWIRKVFIVTDEQTPEWLDTENPKVQVVDHKEIMPKESLPCFNSNLIEHFLDKIPGLSEHFLFANDDMYINRPVSPATFFEADGLPILYVNRKPFRKLALYLRERLIGKPISMYQLFVRNASELVEKHYGKYYGSKLHHNIDAYLKSTITYTNEKFAKDFEPAEARALYGRYPARSVYIRGYGGKAWPLQLRFAQTFVPSAHRQQTPVREVRTIQPAVLLHERFGICQ